MPVMVWSKKAGAIVGAAMGDKTRASADFDTAHQVELPVLRKQAK